MTQDDKASWLDAEATAQQALDLAKKIEAQGKAHLHVTMLILKTLGRAASRESIDQVISELERVRDLTGPAGVAAGDVIATAITTLERASQR
jgi:hypothetical protein